MRNSRADRNPEVETLSCEIRSRVHALPSPEIKAVRNVRSQFSKRLANAQPNLVFELALDLIELPGFEFRFIAYELLQHHPAAFSNLDAAAMQKLGKGIDSWSSVDCFASYLAGPAWRERQIGDNVVRRWSRCRDRWWRRAALVATVPLNNKTRGGAGDPLRTLDICRLLIADRDPMVVKALSWALRELAKRDAPSVRLFLRKERDKLAPQVIREVENKLATGLKNPRRVHKAASAPH